MDWVSKSPKWIEDGWYNIDLPIEPNSIESEELFGQPRLVIHSYPFGYSDLNPPHTGSGAGDAGSKVDKRKILKWKKANDLDYEWVRPGRKQKLKLDSITSEEEFCQPAIQLGKLPPIKVKVRSIKSAIQIDRPEVKRNILNDDEEILLFLLAA